MTEGETVRVAGRVSDPAAHLEVRADGLLVARPAPDDAGAFEVEVALRDGPNRLTVRAEARGGAADLLRCNAAI